MSTSPCGLLEQALILGDELSLLRCNAGISEQIEYIISNEENEVTVRFHAVREGQAWLAEDLESYGEGIAAIRLTGMTAKCLLS